MSLGVTIALGRTDFAFGRLDRLLLLLEIVQPGSDQEMMTQDTKGRWSYTVTINSELLPKLRKVLHHNGRFKITKIIDYEDGQEVAQGR